MPKEKNNVRMTSRPDFNKINHNQRYDYIQYALEDLSNGSQNLYTNELFVSLSGIDEETHGTENYPYRTLKYALSQIDDNAADNRYTIFMGTGIFQEDNPIQLKEWTGVKSISSKFASTLAPLNNDDLLLGNANTAVASMGFIHTSGYGYRMATSGNAILEDTVFLNCQNGICVDGVNAIVNSKNVTFSSTGIPMENGIRCDRGLNTFRTIDVLREPTISKLINLKGTSTTTVKDVVSFSPNIDTAFDIGASARCVISDCEIIGAVNGFRINDVADCRINNSFIFNSQNVGMSITSGDDINIGVNSLVLQDSVGRDLEILTSGALFYGTGYLAAPKKYIDANANVYGNFIDLTDGDEGVNTFGEMHVGSPRRPAEAVFGGGDSYAGIDSIYAYLYDGSTSAWTDITVTAASNTGSSFYTPSAADSAVYVASRIPDNGTFLQHYGIKLKIKNAAHELPDVDDITITNTIVSGGYNYLNDYDDNPLFIRDDELWYHFYKDGFWCLHDSYPPHNFKSRDAAYVSIYIEGTYIGQNGYTGTPIVNITYIDESTLHSTEYYNGTTSAWEPVETMATQADGLYLPLGNEVLQWEGSSQIRYNILLNNRLDWQENDPMGLGTDYYWMRFRWTSAVGQVAEVEQIKLHTNRTEINKDGWQEFFGNARPTGKLPWSVAGLQRATTNPGQGDIFYSDTLDIGFNENALTAPGMRVGFTDVLPPDLDTSCPVKVKFAVRLDGTGDFNYILRWTYANPGSSIFPAALDAPTTHPNEQLLTGSVSGLDDTIVWFEEELYFNKSIAQRPPGYPDTIAMTIERDTGGVSTDLVILDAEYIKWTHGGHI